MLKEIKKIDKMSHNKKIKIDMKKEEIRALEEKYAKVVEDEMRRFANKVFNTLREFNININITPITFVGGGATVMKTYGENTGKNIT